MNNKNQVVPNLLSTEALNELIIESIQDTKGEKIVKLDLRQLSESPADFFIICEGNSSTQVRAIAENIRTKVKEVAGVTPNHLEGASGSKWVLVDYFSTVVHVFHPELRAYYQLEDLWSDAKTVEYENLS